MLGELNFVPYQSSWATRFEALRDMWAPVLPSGAKVEHVGSTSVPGLAAKNCVDVLVTVPRGHLVPATTALEEAGLQYRPGTFADDPDRRFLRLVENDSRAAHVHLFSEGHPAIDEMIATRDLLRRDASWRRRYAQIKEILATRHPADRPAYLAGKDAFVKELTAVAVSQPSPSADPS
ncbi:GrpB family protein [Ornithinimicrobium faecis]|uniref:GrpB family protein n=1 Tax=Ornithinimicrobium faecis TaxID=2934158 RepID=A0ABY4YTH5_9MICO|nr:GrpB family protein [Ornithinimicrobium sp. HY1793]USQ80033.1 GrpB family protein [Ornithinimicrobium sp. HY1793]